MRKGTSTPAEQKPTSADIEIDSLQLSDEAAEGETPPSPRTVARQKRRKNADAQAAFRARRANYIANLEETVTTLESAVRQLQDACRDARDDARESKEENKRLLAVIDSMKQDAWRSAIFNEPRGSFDTSALMPPAAGNYRPTLPSPFAIPSAGMMPPSGSGSRTPYPSSLPIANEASSSRQSFTSLMTAFTHAQGNERVGDWLAEGTGSSSGAAGQAASTQSTHTRPRLASRSPPLSPLPPTKFLSEMSEAQIDTPPSFASGSLSPSADNQSHHSPVVMQRSQHSDFSGLSMFGHATGGHGSLDFDAGRMNPAWSPLSYSPGTGTPSFSAGLSRDMDDFDLSRPDTVRVSQFASGRRDARAYGRASPGLRAPGSQSSHSRVPSNEQDLHNADARHDLGRSGPPSSTSSPYSHDPVSPREGPSPGPSSGKGKHPLAGSRSRRRYSPPPVHASDEGDDDDEEGESGGPSPSDVVVPFSDTLALVKASAFGTNRRTRTRTRRPGADIAANEVLNALNARGMDMGLDVDLDLAAPKRKRSKKGDQEDD